MTTTRGEATMARNAESKQSWMGFLGTWLGGIGWAALHGLMGVIFTLVFAFAAIILLEILVFALPNLLHGFALASAIASGAFVGFVVFRMEREIPRARLQQVKIPKLGWIALLLYANAVITLATLGGWLLWALSGSFIAAAGVVLLYPALDNWMSRNLHFSIGKVIVLAILNTGLFIKELLDDQRHDETVARSVLQDEWGSMTTQAHYDLQRKMRMRPM